MGMRVAFIKTLVSAFTALHTSKPRRRSAACRRARSAYLVEAQMLANAVAARPGPSGWRSAPIGNLGWSAGWSDILRRKLELRIKWLPRTYFSGPGSHFKSKLRNRRWALRGHFFVHLGPHRQF